VNCATRSEGEVSNMNSFSGPVTNTHRLITPLLGEEEKHGGNGLGYNW